MTYQPTHPVHDAPLASVTPIGGPSTQRSRWLEVCERAWSADPNGPGAAAQHRGTLARVRAEAQRSGDDFVAAAADVARLHLEPDPSVVVSGLVPAVADLETYPTSVWLGRAHGLLGAIFARLGETDRAREHLVARREIGELLEDLELQAGAMTAIARITPAGDDRLEALALAEMLYARDSLERERSAEGGIRTRLDRARTHVELGLVGAATEQLSQVVSLAHENDQPEEEVLALALQASCLATSGSPLEGAELAELSCLRALDVEPARRPPLLVACARALVESGRAERALEVLDIPVSVLDPDDEQAVLTQTADALAALDRPLDAYAVMARVDDLAADRERVRERHRLHVMRRYHRTRSAEHELSTQRDLSARILEQVAHLTARHPGSTDAGVRDAVTSLPNRRYLDLELRWRCSQRLPGHGVLSLVIVALDGYAELRAARGQEEADRLAAVCGQIVRGSVRAGDAVARFSEDSFAVIQFHRSPDAAAFAGERLRAAVADFPWKEHHRAGERGPDPTAGELARQVAPLAARVADMTASVGIAAIQPPIPPGSLVGRAAAAVDHVRRGGGNGVRVAG